MLLEMIFMEGTIMSKKALIIIGAIIVLVGIYFASSYNSLVAMNENVKVNLSQIDNQLQRRNDLIPNLVETVKGYASQEKEIFKAVSDARSKLAGAGSLPQKAEASSELTGALSRLLVIMENYPQLKSDANFRQLSDELAGTENRISVARRDYNQAAQSYNTTIRKFPKSMIAGMFNFEKADYFEASKEAKEVPKVNFGG